MAAEHYVMMIDATFAYFGPLTKRYQDPASLDAVQQVRTQMVNDLASFPGKPSPAELAELCRRWRARRIEAEGPATYAPDMFIESVCQVIELS